MILLCLQTGHFKYSIVFNYINHLFQFDLYCEKEAYSLLATSLVFVAWAIGSIVLGWVSDR